MGASNELPESEELDALYDRFLIRRQVSQVSQAGLLEMLANGGGRKQVGVGGARGCLSMCVRGGGAAAGVSVHLYAGLLGGWSWGATFLARAQAARSTCWIQGRRLV